MCTAITFTADSHYFGRNLDLEFSYGESVVITPRRFPFVFRNGRSLDEHLAFIGAATVVDGYPLYYDATNEAGLSMAALNFVGNVHFYPPKNDGTDIAQFEFIPFILGSCKSVPEALDALDRVNLVATPFSPELPPSELHYMIADRERSIVVEPMKEGVRIYESRVGVLTNNPPFPYQLEHLAMYLNLSADEPQNRFSQRLDITPSSRGMGAYGLPGDDSSPSRFVRAAFTLLNSVKPSSEAESVSQFFHILSAVEQVEGRVKVKDKLERTQYSSCCNTDTGVYYYRTYQNSRISAVKLHSCELDGDRIRIFPFMLTEDVKFEN